jgi:multiple sugar transport system permease protein
MSSKWISRHTRDGLLWTSPWLVGGAVFILLPMAMSLYYAHTNYSMLESPIFIGWQNFSRMLSDTRLHLAAWNTAVFSVIFIPLATLFALVLAAMLAGEGKLPRFVQACVFVPTLVPMVASAMVWMWLFNGEYGLINQGLKLIGVTGPNWLIDRAWAIPALVIMSLWGVGQQVVIYIAAMQDVPRELYEAARLDGMGRAGQFWRVTLPGISPQIVFGVMVQTIATIQIFAQPFVMFRNKDGQNDAGLFYTMHLYDNAFVYLNMGYASAMAWMQFVVVLIITQIMMLASKRFVVYRGGGR